MAGIGKGGGSYAGWTGSGAGSGSGGGGDTDQFSGVVGQAGGPVAGASTWIPGGVGSEELIGATELNTMQVDKVNLTSLGAAPDFTLNNVTGEINISPSVWVAGAVVNGWYKPA